MTLWALYIIWGKLVFEVATRTYHSTPHAQKQNYYCTLPPPPPATTTQWTCCIHLPEAPLFKKKPQSFVSFTHNYSIGVIRKVIESQMQLFDNNSNFNCIFVKLNLIKFGIFVEYSRPCLQLIRGCWTRVVSLLKNHCLSPLHKHNVEEQPIVNGL